ncbi:MAG: NAD(P)/FAD-dependent oxidoreductase [Vampirovibrionales bacterium]|nr:NAD(P)/FAD-dependent oxidoreductase [Vampirovibrionales bacterium]
MTTPQPEKQTKPYDFILIGGGTASLAALSELLERLQSNSQIRIALVDKQEELGGECALNACVPTKTLLSAARYIQLLKGKMAPYGIQNIRYDFDFKALGEKVDQVIHDGGYDFLNDKRVEWIQGEARFISANTLSVKTKNGLLQLSSERILLATGAVPVIPPIEGLEEVGYLTYREATHLSVLPKSLMVLGAGPVGVEFSQMFQTLGVQVTLLQKGERLLENEEPEISAAIQQILEKQGVVVVTGCDIDKATCALLQKDKSQSSCDLKSIQANVQTGNSQASKRFEAEEILLAVGMRPNLDSLNLHEAGIDFSKEGIAVNGEMKSANPNVWAVGDVVGQYQFTHVADYQAVIAAHNMLEKDKRTVDYTGLGWAVFTEPTIAHVGLTQAEAEEQGIMVDTIMVSTELVSRYRIESEKKGFLKLIVARQSKLVLGGHFFCTHADDIAHMLMLAVRNRMRVEQLLDVLYIYPAKAQLVQKALEKFVSKQRLKPSACSGVG